MRTSRFSLVLLVAGMGAPASAQRPRVQFERESLTVYSGIHDGSSETRLAFRDVIDFPGAPEIRLHIAEYHLGQASYIILRSSVDGDEQRLDAKSLPMWQNATAVFKGDAVEVELHVAPGDEGVFVKFDEMIGGYAAGHEPGEGALRTLCGDDSRRPTCTTGGCNTLTRAIDNRIGRRGLGTFFYITNGLFLTAGHAMDGNGDGTLGPVEWNLNLPVSFRTPCSNPNGSTNEAADADKFFILGTGYAVFLNGDSGEDWGVFEVQPNCGPPPHPVPCGATPPQMPWERYGTIGFKPSDETPDNNETIRITGFGLDNTPLGTTGRNNCNHNTQQTDTGPFRGENEKDRNRIQLDYRVDTTDGNSGGPIISAGLGFDVAIGIHTTSRCHLDFVESNRGTAFKVRDLTVAMHNFPVRSGKFSGWFWHVRYVDRGHPFTGSGGSILRPYKTVKQAAAEIGTYGVISIVAGNYPKAEGNTFTVGADGKDIIFDAPVGSVVIGN